VTTAALNGGQKPGRWRRMISAGLWLRSYDPSTFRCDLAAGVTLAAYLLPAALGDASLAGLPPEAGIHACLFGGLVFWLFCSSRHTAISVTSWDHLATSHRARLMENVSHYSQASNEYLAALQANGLSTKQAYGAVERIINAQSFMLATNDFFLYCAVAFFTLIGFVWLTKPKKKNTFDMQNATGH